MAMAVGLGAGPIEQNGAAPREGSMRWVVLFIALAAGWGALFGYSAIFLTEDLPLRPQSMAALPEAPAFGFPPMPTSPPAPNAAQVHEARAQEAQPAEVKVHRAAAEAVPVAAAPPAPAPRVERAEYVGTWGPNEAACGARSRRRGFIPATITPERASAGRTICSFREGRRSGNAWVMAADCSDRGRRWSSQVRLVVDGDRLTWTSGKGSSSYIRCGRRAG